MDSPGKGRRPEWDSRRVQALRHHLKLTQSEFSRKLGTRQQTVSEWETGMYKPRGTSVTLLSLIAEQANFHYDASLHKRKLDNIHGNV